MKTRTMFSVLVGLSGVAVALSGCAANKPKAANSVAHPMVQANRTMPAVSDNAHRESDSATSGEKPKVLLEYTSSRGPKNSTSNVGQSQAASAKPERKVEDRTLVEDARPLSAEEVRAMAAQVSAVLSPFTIQEVGSEFNPKRGGSRFTIGGPGKALTVASVSRPREDGITITVKSVQEEGDTRPIKVCVYRKIGEVTASDDYHGRVGDIVLRLYGPSDDAIAQPVAFTQVTLYSDSAQEEYTVEGDRWIIRRYTW